MNSVRSLRVNTFWAFGQRRDNEKSSDSADRLLAIGAFCIGTNQIDLEACMQKGISVFNAPFSNTCSVVEMVIGEMIMLMRGTIRKV